MVELPPQPTPQHCRACIFVTVLTPQLLLAGWWFRPEFIINELNINSVITSPSHEETLTLGESMDYTIKGYAYSGQPVSSQLALVYIPASRSTVSACRSCCAAHASG